ncbi:hypothetical protein SAMN04489710_11520 [Paracidovorax konjaci]|uniref:Uncharacterized protein n=1 Tax=Paracidovorax konjaci TaxID=32040 RepID=A0A1I1Y3G3_9BURK|nr:hypothetical protein SAMN04489710_11520 [Paracidovorax konjaci]
MNAVFGFSSRGRVSARRPRTFSLLRQRKGPKRKATLLAASPFARWAKGATCGARSRGAAAKLAARWRAALGHRSQSDHVADVSFGTSARPAPCAPRLIQKGSCRTRAIAALDLGCASAAHRAPFVERDVTLHLDRAQRRSSQAEQRDGPRVLRRPSEATARNAPSGCAWGAQGAGWRVCRRTHPLQHLARRGCLSGARQRAASSAAHPATEHPRSPRSAAKGSQTAGSPFFWVLFFGEAKKSASAAGPRPGPGKQTKKQNSATAQSRRAAEPQSRSAAEPNVTTNQLQKK